MSDPRLRDPLIPPTADPLAPSSMANPPPPYAEDRGNGAMWGFLAVLAILIVGGIFYFKSGPSVVSNAPPAPISTTGTAPQPNPRPMPAPVPPAPPAQNPQ
jgi:hypothetical protein